MQKLISHIKSHQLIKDDIILFDFIRKIKAVISLDFFKLITVILENDLSLNF